MSVTEKAIFGDRHISLYWVFTDTLNQLPLGVLSSSFYSWTNAFFVNRFCFWGYSRLFFSNFPNRFFSCLQECVGMDVYYHPVWVPMPRHFSKVVLTRSGRALWICHGCHNSHLAWWNQPRTKPYTAFRYTHIDSIECTALRPMQGYSIAPMEHRIPDGKLFPRQNFR